MARKQQTVGELLEARGETFQEFCRKSGSSFTTLFRATSGVSKPNSITLQAWARTAGMTAEEFAACIKASVDARAKKGKRAAVAG
jgi:transcriptional regulator with XRE-family HTH domain